MEQYKIKVTDPAENDLRNIISYIATQLSAPETATSMAEHIGKAMFSLAEMPHRHPLVANEQLAWRGFRKVTVRNYNVFFVIHETEGIVRIMRILYARQDWQRML